jgi:hypothetical protein
VGVIHCWGVVGEGVSWLSWLLGMRWWWWLGMREDGSGSQGVRESMGCVVVVGV